MDTFPCDEFCCWVRKEYMSRNYLRVYLMSRNYLRVYPNRIDVNDVKVRFFGRLGCGSWNSDNILAHPFDRGAFGFRPVICGSCSAFGPYMED